MMGLYYIHQGDRDICKNRIQRAAQNTKLIQSKEQKCRRMLTKINPKLPMRNKAITKSFYVDQLGFKELSDYGNYLIIAKDQIEIHFFEFQELDPKKNYAQVYIRTDDINNFYKFLNKKGIPIHPNGKLQDRPWGQREFALLDPDYNLLTFGQSL
jgi:catechol 2,3-dioxygenase-like lactoylglutathione lyase family enzyme